MSTSMKRGDSGIRSTSRAGERRGFCAGQWCRIRRGTAFCKNDTENDPANFFENGCDRRGRRACRCALCDLCPATGCICFYYNPNEVVGIGEGSDNITTTRMSLDLSVYSELFWPGSYRNTVNAVAEGYGTYNISIPQGISYDGKFTTVNGRLKRGKLTLYNTDAFKMPYGNTFMMPEEVEDYAKIHFFDEDTRQFWGPAGSEEEAYASIEKLDDNAYYIAYASLEN